MHPALIHEVRDILSDVRNRVLEIEYLKQIPSLHGHHDAWRHMAPDCMLDLVGFMFELVDLQTSLRNLGVISDGHRLD